MVEHLPNFFQLLFFLSFLLLKLLFMKVVAELLNLSPLVLADIRWNILHYSILFFAGNAFTWLIRAAYTT